MYHLPLSSLREFLFPSGCPLCREPFLDDEEADQGLCSACASLFILDHEIRCPRCGRPLICEEGVCMECRDAPLPGFDRAIALFPYSGDARRLLFAYKFGGYRRLSVFIARLFHEALAGCADTADLLPVVIPVPPKPHKLHEKGWDQVELISRCLEHREGLCVSRNLERLDSKNQKTLGKIDRALNLRGRILCHGSPPREAVLIDDVITTGATLSACATALRAGGSERIVALSLCYD